MKKPKRLRNHAVIVKGAAWSYVILAFLYPVFTASSTKTSLPNEEMESLLATLVSGGASNHLWWTLFTIIPLLLISGGVGFYSAVKPYAYKLSGLSLVFSIFAAMGFMLGIGRWSTLNWGLGEAFLRYKENSEFIASFYRVSNEMLGYWIGQIFAETSLFASIGIMSIAMFYSKRFPVWLSGFASVISILGFAATFRDMTLASSAMHWLLSTFMLVPIFFILLSISLFRFVGKPHEKSVKKKKIKEVGKPKKRRKSRKKSKKAQ